MKNFFEHIFLKWPIYLCLFILSIVLWLLVIDAIIAPSKKEKVGLFVGSYGISSDLKEEVDLPSYIKEFTICDANVNQNYYFVIFDSFASSNEFDISIVAENQFRESDIQYYQKLDENIIINYFGKQDYFYVNDDIYGFKVYDKTTRKGILSNYITYSNSTAEGQDYYIFFHSKSIHIGEFNNSPYNGAIEIVKDLLVKSSE